MDVELDTDVIIVGGGPVGLSAALDLDRRGIRSVVLERRAFLEAPNVKCNHVSARTMERFRQLGLAESIRNAGLPADHPQDVAFCTTLTGTELARIRIPSRAERTTGGEGPDTDWATPEPPHRINQRYMEPIMMKHAAARPHITLLNEVEYQHFRQDAEGVEAVLTDRDDDGGRRIRRVRGKFLIGCDGGKSAVRKQMGATLSGDAVLQHVQSTCIRAPRLHEMSAIGPAWGYYTFNPRRNGHIYSIDGREVFLVHNHLQAGESIDQVDRDSSIRAILGVSEDFKYDILSKEDWVARRLVANRFRQDRVFIAGDACHLWVPYAGYGMNAGIADALNLTWLLGAYLSGWAEYGILEAYEAERQPITEQVSRFAMTHQRKVTQADVPDDIEDATAEGATARAEIGRRAYELNVQQFAAAGLNFGYNYSNSPIIRHDAELPPPYSMGHYTPSTVPGCRAPHFWMNGESVYDHFGTAYTLLCFGEFSTAAPLLAAAEGSGLPMVVVQPPAGVAPPEYRHALVLCRDDQHIVWRGDIPPEDPVDLIHQLQGKSVHSAVV